MSLGSHRDMKKDTHEKNPCLLIAQIALPVMAAISTYIYTYISSRFIVDFIRPRMQTCVTFRTISRQQLETCLERGSRRSTHQRNTMGGEVKVDCQLWNMTTGCLHYLGMYVYRK